MVLSRTLVALVLVASVLAVTTTNPAMAGVISSSITADPDGSGYWVLAVDGTVSATEATQYGDIADQVRDNGESAVSIAANPAGDGYWILTVDGTVSALGSARDFGSFTQLADATQAVAIVATPSGLGYWVVTTDGGVFAFGDAGFYGSLGGIALAAPIVDIVATHTGQGYLLLGADGGVFAFGDADFFGSAAGFVDGSAAAIVSGPDGVGYRIVEASGSEFRFGVKPLGLPHAFVPLSGIVDAASVGAGELLVLSSDGEVLLHDLGNDEVADALAGARLAWAQASIADYVLAVSGSWSFWCQVLTITTVEDSDPVGHVHVPLSSYSECGDYEMTVEGLHDLIEDGLATAVVAAGFDENGVPTTYTFNVPDSVDEERSLAIRFVELPAEPAGSSAPTNDVFTNALWKADPVAIASGAGVGGFLVLRADGTIEAGDGAADLGDARSHLVQPDGKAVDIAVDPDGSGYWVTADDGSVYTFGDSGFHGSLGALALNEPIVAMASTASGNGYWLAASDGGVFAFGDAGFHGSLGAIALNEPIVDIEATPSGLGYWLVAADGGVFAFGDAWFLGSRAGGLGQFERAVALEVAHTGDYTLYTSLGRVLLHTVNGNTFDGDASVGGELVDVAQYSGGLRLLRADGTVVNLAGPTVDWGATVEANRAIWAGGRSGAYAFVLTGIVDETCGRTSMLISVVGDEVFDADPPAEPGNDCAASPTIDQLYDLMRDRLARQGPAIVDADFSESGVPTRFVFDDPFVEGDLVEFELTLAPPRPD